MITGYAIQANNKIYVVPTQTKRFTRAIADIFIKHIFSEIIKTHPEITPDIIYSDMVKNKRYYKLSWEYRAETETENGIEPRYYISTKNIIGYYKPEVFTVLNPESEV